MDLGPTPALRVELPAGQTLQRNLAALLRTVGAEVPARVLSVNALLGSRNQYEVLLSLIGHRVSARTAEPLSPGATVRLRVTGENRLQVLPSAPPPVAPQARAQARIEQLLDVALRNALPRQQPLQPALQALRAALAQPARSDPTQPPAPENSRPGVLDSQSRVAIGKLFEQLPTLGDLRDATRLASAVARSGLFLEHNLARGEGPAADAAKTDLKALLLRAAQQLRAASHTAGAAAETLPVAGEGDAARRIQALLARLQGQQLSNLTAQLGNAGEAPPAVRLALELPFLDGAQIQSLSLAVSREAPPPGGQEKAAEPAWSVALDFDLGELGGLHVQAWLRDHQLSTVFWATREATLGLVQQHLGQLREQLAAHRIQLEQTACHHGVPPRAGVAHPRALIDLAT